MTIETAGLRHRGLGLAGVIALPPFRPSEYGEHLTRLWNRILEQTWFFPWFDVSPKARLPMAHDDPPRVDAVIREMLDSGDVSDHPYQYQFEAFFNALDAGVEMPRTSLRESMLSHRAVLAADLSAAENREVKLSEVK